MADTPKNLKEKKSFQTSTELFSSDTKLSSVETKWGHAASADSIEKTRKALVEKSYKVDVVANKDEALRLLTSLDVKDSSIYAAGSTTLSEIGFTTFLKDNKDYAKRNIKAEFVEAQASGDQAKAVQLLREGQFADVFFSSVSSIAETGEIHVVCATGSRTGGFITAGRLVLVIGSNKITPDFATALKRTREYALPLASASVRIAYAHLGYPGTVINFECVLHGESSFAATSRVHVILVKEALGY
jgi:hypothetical protein